MPDFVEGADLLGGAQRRQHETIFLDLDRADPLARVHHQAPDGDHALLLHRLANNGESLDAVFAVRDQRIGRIPVQAIDAGTRDKLLDVDYTRRFELHTLEVFLVE